MPEGKLDQQRLEELRKELTNLDEHLIYVLYKRMYVSEKVGQTKKAIGLPAEQRELADKRLDQLLLKADIYGLNKDLIISVFNLIHKESVRIQNEMINQK